MEEQKQNEGQNGGRKESLVSHDVSPVDQDLTLYNGCQLSKGQKREIFVNFRYRTPHLNFPVCQTGIVPHFADFN